MKAAATPSGPSADLQASSPQKAKRSVPRAVLAQVAKAGPVVTWSVAMSKQRDVLAYISPDEEKEPQALTRELERVEEKNLEFYEAFSNKDIDRMSGVW